MLRLKNWLLGNPLPTSAHAEERLSNPEALAVLSSDALSSVAYATQEIVLVLGTAGAAALNLTMPITLAILSLMAIVAISYRQTIKAYPHGGGSYSVASENLGSGPGLVAGASLAIDYVLTVTVSIAAGIAALTSYVPALVDWTVPLCLAATLVLMVINLRGLRSSAAVLSLPTFAFIGAILLMLAMGLARLVKGDLSAIPETVQTQELLEAHKGALQPLVPFLVMRAFSSGCAALTGIEAISNGVMVFRKPEWRNAQTVLTGMVIILGTMFGGISYLSTHLGLTFREDGPTLLYQLGEKVFEGGPLLFFLQLATLLILLLAANTAYADFPRLAALLARDGYLPRQMSLLGDRLVFSNGILILSAVSGLLTILFGGSVSRLIPLYAVGVFTSFTLSQAGMVVHWFREQEDGWQRRATINAIGCVVTGIVSVVLLLSKFTEGAWIVVLAVPVVVSLFLAIHNHYRFCAARLRMASDVALKLPPLDPERHTPVLVLVGQLHRGSFEAIRYAHTIGSEVLAVHVDFGTGAADRFREQWQRQLPGVPLMVLDSPYRSLIEPVTEFVRAWEREHRKDKHRFCTVVLPVFVTRHRWENLLHNQSTLFLRTALRKQGTRVVTTVGFYL